MIKEVDKNDLKQALDLVNEVFSEFVAVDYSEQGNKTFEDYLKIKYDEMSSDIETGHKKLWGYYQNDEIIGVIATRDISHIALMFVDKRHHRKGIARQLLNTVLAEIKDNANTTRMTVNSSPYAAPAYERLGFVKTDEQQEKDGIIYIPMAKPLYTIRHITENKKDLLPLLLLGDEQESQIDRYLERGDTFALYDGDYKSVCVVTDEGSGVLEIQNIATDKRYQQKGYASRLINYIAGYYAGRYEKIILGTGDVPGI